jgi:hypothetical protein
VFATEQIQKVTTPTELDYFMSNQTWAWDPEVEQLYINATKHNPIISDAPIHALGYAKRIYSQGQILQILVNQSPEGRFLINGVSIPSNADRNGKGDYVYTSGQMKPPHSTIKCDLEGNLQQITSPSSTSSTSSTITNYNTLSELIPGFKWTTDNTNCNPCKAFISGNGEEPPDYSCQFSIT